MSHNTNTIESQSELNPCNDGKRSSDVVIEALNKLEEMQRKSIILERIFAVIGIIRGIIITYIIQELNK
jgi:hypothetical protein